MKKCILLIDDDEDELKIFTEALHDLNDQFHCVLVQNAEAALHLLSNFIPDYIFLDFNMPRTDGLKCLASMGQKICLEKTPVFLYSNCITDQTQKKALELGAAGCIQKPDTIEALCLVLQKNLPLVDQHSSAKP
jgi:CheY-like chemotaxis protein